MAPSFQIGWTLTWRAWLVAALAVSVSGMPASGEADTTLGPQDAAEAAALREGPGHRPASEQRRQAVEAAPDDTQVARRELGPALRTVADQLSPEAAGVDHPWTWWASDHVLRLEAEGRLAADDALVLDAWATQAVLARLTGRFEHAWQSIEALAERLPAEDAWPEAMRLDLYAVAGHTAPAVQLAARLAERDDWSAGRYTRHFSGPVNRAWVQAQADRVRDAQPSLPRPWQFLTLENRWQQIVTSMVDGPPSPHALAALLHEAGTSSLGPSRDAESTAHASLWRRVERAWHDLPPASVDATLLEQMNQPAAEALASATQALDPAALMRVFRRWPMTRAGQEAMLLYGELAWRRGQIGLASRAFEDANTWAREPAVHRRAALGRRLAREAITHASEDLPLEAGLPERVAWPLAESGPVLMEGLFSPAGREERIIHQPQFRRTFRQTRTVAGAAELHPYWQRPSVTALSDGALLVATMWAAGVYDPATATLRWQHRVARGVHHQLQRESTQGSWLAPAPRRPAVAGQRVVMRGGIDRTGRQPTDVRAFDLRSGALLWSTRETNGLGHVWPAGPPVVADGRVYVLVAGRGLFNEMALVCLDLDTGRQLWQQPLAGQDLVPVAAEGSGFARETFDLVRYGAALTVHAGAVYCNSSAGFVVRCDARDGTIDWLHVYERAPVSTNWRRLAARGPTPPRVAGEAVVFAPRDRMGAFALDADTGRLRWDRGFAVSDELLGVAPGVVLTRAFHPLTELSTEIEPVHEQRYPTFATPGETVAALDMATGQTRWQTFFPQGLAARPAVHGEQLYLSAGDAGVVALDTHTGQAVSGDVASVASPTGTWADSHWLAKDAGRLRQVTFGPAGETAAVAPLADRQPPPVVAGWREAWQFALVRPRVWTLDPPATNKQPSPQLAVAAEGLLHALQVTPEARRLWHYPIADGLLDVQPEGELLLLRYPRQVIALNRHTGAAQWRANVPFRIEQVRMAGQRVLLAGGDRRTSHLELASLDRDTGEPQWQRRLAAFVVGETLAEVDKADIGHGLHWDGQHLSLFVAEAHDQATGQALPSAVWVRLAPDTGRVVHAELVGDDADMPLRPVHVAYDASRGEGVLVTDRQEIYSFDMSQPHATMMRLGQAEHAQREATTLTIADGWIIYRTPRTQVVLKHHEPTYRFELDRASRVMVSLAGRPMRGKRDGRKVADRWYAFDGNQLTAYDLHTSQQLFTARIATGDWHHLPHLLDVHHHDGRVELVTAFEAFEQQHVRIDRLDLHTGEPLQTGVLQNARHWRTGTEPDDVGTRAHRVDDMLLISDDRGLHALARADDAYAPLDGPFTDAPYVAALPTDGDTPAADELRPLIVTTPHGDAHVNLWHDGTRLVIDVTVPHPPHQSATNPSPHAAGHWLQLHLQALERTRHWSLGIDPDGSPALRSLDGHDLLNGMQAQVQPNPAAGTTHYRLAVPLNALADRRFSDWRPMRLSVAHWRHTQPGTPLVPLALFGFDAGDGIRPVQPALDFFVNPRTRRQTDAAWQVVDALPELDWSRQFVREAFTYRQRSLAGARSLSRRLLAAHPIGKLADDVLGWSDLFTSTFDPAAAHATRALARELGVSEAARQRHDRLARAHFVQHYYIAGPQSPDMLAIKFHHDGPGQPRRAFVGSAFWGVGSISWVTGRIDSAALRFVQTMPAPGQWHTLRLPLTALDLHNVAITGVEYHARNTRDNAQVIWSPLRLVTAEGETVLFEGTLPEGEPARDWQWVDPPDNTFASAHATPRQQDPVRIASTNWAAPFDHHLEPHTPSPPPPATAEVTDRLAELLPQLNPRDARDIVDQWLAIADDLDDAHRQRLRRLLP